jgi:hypothetical protein
MIMYEMWIFSSLCTPRKSRFSLSRYPTVMPHGRHPVGSGPVANVKMTLALMSAGLGMTLKVEIPFYGALAH